MISQDNLRALEDGTELYSISTVSLPVHTGKIRISEHGRSFKIIGGQAPVFFSTYLY